MMKIAFIDRDGTLIFEPPDTDQVDSLERLKVLPGVVDGLKNLIEEGYKLVMVTNQNGIGSPSFPTESFEIPQKKLLEILKDGGVEFYRIFICPHFASEGCVCRKPKIGMVEKFLKENEIDLEKSFVLGDRITDLEFASNIGVFGMKMMTNSFFPRIAAVQRVTAETDIFMMLNLDGTGQYQVDTGVKFLDHMLEQFSKHSLIDLKLRVRGDLEVDEHHTVEDVALVLGGALLKALGDKRGVGRYGFTLPMDDTLVEVALDLGGRSYLVFNAEFKREKAGDLPTELVEHFFRSLADNLKANVHINVRYSRNEHHKIEAIFKAFAKAMRMACEKDDRSGENLPTTKKIL